ncbi:MAG: ABC transporter ATP-binding protein [Lachnospiraceae bacterium]|nr:ABC transporter ATP-binding protein [Lachnospiraceae bacterium]
MNKLKKLWNDRENQMQYAKWLVGYTKPYVSRIIGIMLLGILVSMISVGMSLLMKQIIDRAQAGQRSVLYIIVLYFGLVVVMQAVDIVLVLASTMLTERFSFGIRKQLYDKIIRSHWMDVKRYHTGDLMTRMTSDAGAIADGIIGTMPNIISLAVELVAVFAVLFYYSPMLAVFALVIAPIAALMAWWLGRKLKTLQVKVQETESAYRSFMQESLANLLIVKAFANENYSMERLTELREQRFFWVFKKTKYGLVSSTVMAMSFQLGYIVALTYGAMQIANGQITYGTMSLFLTLVGRIQSPIMQLARQIPKVVAILASAGRVMELQDIPKEECLPERMNAERVGVKVQNLSFGYTDELVLQDINLDIKPGEFVAIVGESGIGKTTLIRLMMSFMKSAQGTITFVNQDGEEEAANAGTREFLSYVPQGNTLFSGTIRENIRQGNLNATEEEMIEALKMASAFDFVMELPQGIDTRIGERGHGISEGQAQRIAIARAFVRKAPFLILDEATSALDEKTEIKVLQGLQSLEPKPTCLIITHRKSILEYCDREIKIENKGTMEI